MDVFWRRAVLKNRAPARPIERMDFPRAGVVSCRPETVSTVQGPDWNYRHIERIPVMRIIGGLSPHPLSRHKEHWFGKG